MNKVSDVIRINLWSGPRNISTALMYSFAQRSDTTVIDEPLYAHYLNETGANHPGRNEVLQSQEVDGKKVISEIVTGACNTPVLFCKQMTHHLIHLDMNFLSKTKNIILIRDPKEVLISYSKVISHPVLADIGIVQSFHLYKFLEEKNFHRMVVDSSEVLKNPRGMLQAICSKIDIPFEEQMLQWNAGPKKEDGIWASYWYGNVHRSTGFTSFKKPTAPLPASLENIYEEATPFYDFLYERSLRLSINP